MKKTLIIFLISLFTGGIAISQQAYTMYQTMYITPKKGLENVFKENLMAHIKKYHSAAPYEVRAVQHSFREGGHRAEQRVRPGPGRAIEPRPERTAPERVLREQPRLLAGRRGV